MSRTVGILTHLGPMAVPQRHYAFPQKQAAAASTAATKALVASSLKAGVGTGHAGAVETVPTNLRAATGSVAASHSTVASSLRAGAGAGSASATLVASSLVAGAGTGHATATETVPTGIHHATAALSVVATEAVLTNLASGEGTLGAVGVGSSAGAQVYAASAAGTATATRIASSIVAGAAGVSESATFIVSAIVAGEGGLTARGVLAVTANLKTFTVGIMARGVASAPSSFVTGGRVWILPATANTFVLVPPPVTFTLTGPANSFTLPDAG